MTAMVDYSELPTQEYSAHHFPAHNSHLQELPANNYFVPIPPAYQNNPSIPPKKGSEFQPRISDESHHGSIMGTEGPKSTKERIKALFRFLIFNSKEYTRIIIILIMIVSLILMLLPLVIWEKAQKKPNDYDDTPNSPPITTKPCVMFAGVATMNFAISVILLALSLLSSKFRKSLDIVNVVFAIVSAIGFSTAMGACFYLSGGVRNKVDLWKWSCDKYKNGYDSQVLDFHFMCKTLTLAWDFGILQTALELYTLVVSVIAYVLIKCQYYAKYGRFGKIF
ncbi:hypothetical protein EPUL_005505 [Erysiphe pulchra]|uniref:MARVEL domain-containing protein n=1 Tax=Erysiphe pulchra TaxID=225359 RepID=A0A2S4PMC8_9PEZI|nr:hypothetical protein EPUL_005505 [Erysiphe pulchra]